MGPPASAAGERLRARVAALPRPRPELVGLLVLAAVLYLWALDQNSWANQYYSAAVRSMSASWHNFFYDSFDPSGVMTVDKPPLGLWVQALSVRVFGYHPLSMLIPQALMGVATVGLVYDLVRRRFGRTAGFVGGLVLALTPITVAISRHNNPDAMLILCCVAALWFVVRGLEDGRTRWLVLAGVSVGLGFETKMSAALLVVPALVAAWLWVAPRGRLAALRQLFAGGVAMVVVGGAWPLLMALTPAADRPWISGTSDNSILSLILNYNGVGRLDGQAGGPQAVGGGGGGIRGGGLFGGSAGPLRLLNETFGGQAGWLLGIALVGGIAVLVASRLRRSDARSGWLIATGGAFLTTVVALSVAQGIIHPYYIAQLAPFTAALVGAGAAQLLTGDRVARVLAPLAVAAGVAAELVVLDNNPGQLTWLVPLLVGVGLLTAAALAVLNRGRLRTAVLGAALAALLVAPASWAVDTLGHPTNGTFPAGGPITSGIGQGPGGRGGPPGGLAGRPPNGFGAPPGLGAGAGAPGGGAPAAPGGAGGFPGAGASAGGRAGMAGGGGGGPFGADSGSLKQVLQYVNAHSSGTIAVSSQQGAASQIISSGADVAGIGGFSGRESVVSVKWLADEVQSGGIRWVLTSDTGGRGLRADTRVGSSRAMAAVAKSCTRVTVPGAATTGTAGGGASSTITLYDCQGQAAALRAAA
jgi:4-amino-4-deoxy-L-arabinose transferase-like glycosyltransferase